MNTLRGSVAPGGIFYAPSNTTFPLTSKMTDASGRPFNHTLSNQALPNGTHVYFEREEFGRAINVRAV